jgi:hypothetical protein
MVLGPVCSALLYPWIGLRGLLLFNGLSYFLAAVVEANIPLKKSATQSEPSLSPDLARSTLNVLRSDRLVGFVLISFCLMNLVLSPMIAFLPLFSREIFQGRIGTFASLEAALGIGTVAGGIALSMMQFQAKTGSRAITGILVIATMYFLFGLNREPLIACLVLCVLGVALTVVNVTMMTFFQTRPAPADVPVVMSLVNLISAGVVPVSMLLVGSIVGQVDLRKLVLTLSASLGVLALGTALNPEFRRA